MYLKFSDKQSQKWRKSNKLLLHAVVNFKPWFEPLNTNKKKTHRESKININNYVSDRFNHY